MELLSAAYMSKIAIKFAKNLIAAFATGMFAGAILNEVRHIENDMKKGDK